MSLNLYLGEVAVWIFQLFTTPLYIQQNHTIYSHMAYIIQLHQSIL